MGRGLSRALQDSLTQEKSMDLQSLIMLIITALTAIYLFYALLRPEKF